MYQFLLWEELSEADTVSCECLPNIDSHVFLYSIGYLSFGKDLWNCYCALRMCAKLRKIILITSFVCFHPIFHYFFGWEVVIIPVCSGVLTYKFYTYLFFTIFSTSLIFATIFIIKELSLLHFFNENMCIYTSF